LGAERRARPVPARAAAAAREAAELQAAADLIGRHYSELTHPDDLAAQRAAIRRVTRGEAASYEVVKRMLLPDGSMRWVRVSSSPVRDPAGRPIRTVAVFQDITEAKAAAEALRISEERLRLAQSAGGIGAWEVDHATGRRHWSESTYRLWGIAPGTPVTLDLMLSVIHPEDRERFRARVAEAATRQGPLPEMEFRIVRPSDGAVRWLHATGVAMTDEGGRAVRHLGTMRDITAQKEAEAALAESEERFRTLFEAVPVGVAVTDPETLGFVAVNDRACALLGYTREELTRLRLPDIEAAPSEAEIWAKALARAHTMLAAGRWEGAELRALVEAELAAFLPAAEAGPDRGDRPMPRVEVEGAEVTLAPSAAQALSMALHELATNAVKYGALSVPAGRVAVRWHLDHAAGMLRLRWAESGGPPVAVPPRLRFAGDRGHGEGPARRPDRAPVGRRRPRLRDVGADRTRARQDRTGPPPGRHPVTWAGGARRRSRPDPLQRRAEGRPPGHAADRRPADRSAGPRLAQAGAISAKTCATARAGEERGREGQAQRDQAHIAHHRPAPWRGASSGCGPSAPVAAGRTGRRAAMAPPPPAHPGGGRGGAAIAGDRRHPEEGERHAARDRAVGAGADAITGAARKDRQGSRRVPGRAGRARRPASRFAPRAAVRGDRGAEEPVPRPNTARTTAAATAFRPKKTNGGDARDLYPAPSPLGCPVAAGRIGCDAPNPMVRRRRRSGGPSRAAPARPDRFPERRRNEQDRDRPSWPPPQRASPPPRPACPTRPVSPRATRWRCSRSPTSGGPRNPASPTASPRTSSGCSPSGATIRPSAPSWPTRGSTPRRSAGAPSRCSSAPASAPRCGTWLGC
jgi:PAS domain S-box-containing protein